MQLESGNKALERGGNLGTTLSLVLLLGTSELSGSSAEGT